MTLPTVLTTLRRMDPGLQAVDVLRPDAGDLSGAVLGTNEILRSGP